MRAQYCRDIHTGRSRGGIVSISVRLIVNGSKGGGRDRGKRIPAMYLVVQAALSKVGSYAVCNARQSRLCLASSALWHWAEA